MASFDSSYFDPLTGLMTPVYFYESLHRLRSWAQRSDNPVTLIAINLKDLSDDQLLEVARDLNSELRGGDLLARMAPDRFILALVADHLGARQFLFRITNKIKAASNYQVIELTPDKDLAEALSEIEI
ncbi:MAG: diguanylate cyclase [Candidatus Nanopelagicaceae bacterium]|jgi:GGDEF domain-containing protein|nr:diguanylate cyclase [Candidatus Nanopelagicaceae bacterium]